MKLRTLEPRREAEAPGPRSIVEPGTSFLGGSHQAFVLHLDDIVGLIKEVGNPEVEEPLDICP